MVAAVLADGLLGFSLGRGESVTVPDLRGIREADADLPPWATLKTAYRYSDVPAGTVLEQSPAPGSTVKVSDRRPCVLTLTVSLGAEKKAVPNIVGMDARVAAATLRDHGFTAKELRVPGGVANRVLSCSPAPGTPLTVGDTVTVTVADGTAPETVTLPSLVGLSRSSALMELFRLELSVEEVTEEDSDAPVGTVIRQSPPAGSILAKGTAIRLTVSRGIASEPPVTESAPPVEATTP